MHILLLTDIAPCTNLTAGLVLRQLCRFFPPASLSCCIVPAFDLDMHFPPELTAVPKATFPGPRPQPRQLPHNLLTRVPNFAVSWGSELLAAGFSIPRLVDRIVGFARERACTAVWAILQGQTMIRLSHRVARRLDCPLYTQVWDPPRWWLRENRVDSHTSGRVLSQFDVAIRRSRACATASWAMSREYEARYGTRCVTVIRSVDAQLARPAAPMSNSETFVIGLAGQLYASREWGALLCALEESGWRIGGRRVVVRLFGRSAQFAANAAVEFEFRGWREDGELVAALAECDLLYCPYWFDPEFREEASLSFPSKLVTYLATGRPTLFHGPAYSSPARFLTEREAGFVCDGLDSRTIVAQLRRVCSDVDRYRAVAENGARAFREHFTCDIMRERFAEFLGEEFVFGERCGTSGTVVSTM